LLRQISGKATTEPMAPGPPRESCERSPDRHSMPCRITQLAADQREGPSRGERPESASTLRWPLMSYATTVQQGASSQPPAWLTSQTPTFPGSIVALASRTASMTASRFSTRVRRARARPLSRAARSGRRTPRDARGPTSDLVVGFTTRCFCGVVRGGVSVGAAKSFWPLNIPQEPV
jgi:hypothetical protein